MTDKPLTPDRDYPVCPCANCGLERGHDAARVAAPSDGALSDYQRGYVDGFDAPANVAARARVATPSDGLRAAVESITRTTQRPAGRGPYVEHEVDEGHAPGEPCRFCDALAAATLALGQARVAAPSDGEDAPNAWLHEHHPSRFAAPSDGLDEAPEWYRRGWAEGHAAALAATEQPETDE